MNINKSVFFSSFVSLSSILYISKISSISPVYIMGIASVLMFFPLFSRHKFSNNAYLMVTFFTLIYFSVSQFYLATLASYINLVLGLIMSILFGLVSQKVPDQSTRFVVKSVLYFSIFVLGIDSIYRLMNPGLPPTTYMDENVLNQSGNWFYLYKFNSLMFADSNTTALVLMCVFFLVYQSFKLNLISYVKVSILLSIVYILLLLTFSRAAIISLSFVFLFYRFYNRNLIVILIPFLIYVSYIVYSFFQNDGSLATKFYIIDRTISVIRDSSTLNVLFGYGFDRTRDLFGFTAHNLFIEYVLGSGVIGFIVFLSYWVIVFKLLPLEGKLLILSVSITSMSYFLYAGSPFLFVFISISYWLGERYSSIRPHR